MRRTPARGRSRGKGHSFNDDCASVDAYAAPSRDPRVGKNMTGAAFAEKVFDNSVRTRAPRATTCGRPVMRTRRRRGMIGIPQLCDSRRTRTEQPVPLSTLASFVCRASSCAQADLVRPRRCARSRYFRKYKLYQYMAGNGTLKKLLAASWECFLPASSAAPSASESMAAPRWVQPDSDEDYADLGGSTTADRAAQFQAYDILAVTPPDQALPQSQPRSRKNLDEMMTKSMIDWMGESVQASNVVGAQEDNGSISTVPHTTAPNDLSDNPLDLHRSTSKRFP
eukprot:IDg5929t1